MNARDFLALPRNPAHSVTEKQSEPTSETARATHITAVLPKVGQTVPSVSPACRQFLHLAAIALLAASSLRAATPASGLLGYSSRVWHIQDGLTEGAAQTRDGYPGIGASGGLVRFDGVRFTVFSRENTPAFRENSISALLTGKDGALWIGTQGGGVLCNSQTANQVLPTVSILGGHGTGEPYFNPNAFAAVTTATFGNSGRDIIRGLGVFNLNASLFRNFAVKERLKLPFRAESLGVTPQFANPGSTLGTATYDLISSSTGERQIRLALKVMF